jgi:hypothetical protein
LLNDVSHEQLVTLYSKFSSDIEKLQEVPILIPELAALLNFLKEIKETLASTETKFVSLQENFDFLVKNEYNIDPKDLQLLNTLTENWKGFKEKVFLLEKQIEQHRDRFRKLHMQEVEDIRNAQAEMYNKFASDEISKASHEFHGARVLIQKYRDQIIVLPEREAGLRPGCDLFKLESPIFKEIDQIEHDLDIRDKVWTLEEEWNLMWSKWRDDTFRSLEVIAMEEAAVRHGKAVLNLGIKG